MTSFVVSNTNAPTAGRVQRPRRRLIVDRGFQLRLLFPIFLYTVLFFVLTLAFVWLPLHRHLAVDPNPIVRALLAGQLLRIELWLAPLLILSASIAAIATLRHSQRIAGPLWRFRNTLAKLALGDVSPLTFRRRDEFRELEAPYAAVASRLDRLVRGNLEMLHLLRHNLDGIAQRAAKRQLSGEELHSSLTVILHDIDSEIRKLQMKA